MQLSTLSDASLSGALAELERIEARNKLSRYRPYTKQAEFHAFGKTKRERLLRAGNQLGKTYSGAAEMAIHLTGRYPPDWDGRRWSRPIRAWAGGKDSISVRDSLVELLLGKPSERGTGLIPWDAIVEISSAPGIKDGVDSVVVRHETGGTSRLTFKSYDQGRLRWQAATLDLVWLDEEPDQGIYLEALSRTNATAGCLYLTFTPLLGMSDVVRRFLTEDSPDRSDTNMTIEDAEHISQEQRERVIASYPAHERDARTRGTPILGSGRIYPVVEETISVQAFAIPEHWVHIAALDFGWEHPTGAARLAWDRDTDTVYVTAAYQAREKTPAQHALTLKPWGAWLPWAWPHDGNNDTAAGPNLASQYGAQGLNMLPERATFDDGTNSVEAGLMDILERMETGRFKVFAHLTDWFDEFRLYHRKDGKVVKLADDLMDATRYGVMSLRFARTAEVKRLKLPELPNRPRGTKHGWLGR